MRSVCLAVCLAVCLVAFGVLSASGQDPAVIVKVTTDPNGGDGLSELPPGASSVYIYAEGTGSIDGFLFDLEPSGLDLVLLGVDIGPAFDPPDAPEFIRDEKLAIDGPNEDDIFGWIGFRADRSPTLPFTGRILLAVLDVRVPEGVVGDAARLDLTGKGWYYSIDYVWLDDASQLQLSLPGPSAGSSTGGDTGGDTGGGTGGDSGGGSSGSGGGSGSDSGVPSDGDAGSSVDGTDPVDPTGTDDEGQTPTDGDEPSSTTPTDENSDTTTDESDPPSSILTMNPPVTPMCGLAGMAEVLAMFAGLAWMSLASRT